MIPLSFYIVFFRLSSFKPYPGVRVNGIWQLRQIPSDHKLLDAKPNAALLGIIAEEC